MNFKCLFGHNWSYSDINTWYKSIGDVTRFKKRKCLRCGEEENLERIEVRWDGCILETWKRTTGESQ